MVQETSTDATVGLEVLSWLVMRPLVKQTIARATNSLFNMAGSRVWQARA